MHTLHGYNVNILSEKKNTSLQDILQANRPYSQDPTFFSPQISQLHDPYLLPDMEVSVNRILEARKKKERIVIF